MSWRAARVPEWCGGRRAGVAPGDLWLPLSCTVRNEIEKKNSKKDSKLIKYFVEVRRRQGDVRARCRTVGLDILWRVGGGGGAP